jgi:nucleoside-diphosphate-sugar epimerase
MGGVMNTLVIGDAGYIGSSLVDTLRAVHFLGLFW